jgi:hypothetical protein
MIFKRTVAGFGISYKDGSKSKDAPEVPVACLVYSDLPLGGFGAVLYF